MEKQRILVVDDEPRYVRSITVILQANGYEVLSANDGEKAVELAASEDLDLILLDIRMPKMDGYEASRKIREFSSVPIIMLTALAEETDKVVGLDAGADDYITKPFSGEELKARLRAVLRRASFNEAQSAAPIAEFGKLKIDFSRSRVWIYESEIHLTSTEYRLLIELAHHVGRVLTPEQILSRVWGSGYEGDEKLVWQVVYRLRKKIEDNPSKPQYIRNKPGIGYFLNVPGGY